MTSIALVKAISDAFAPIVAALIAIAGVVWGAYEYRSRLKQNKIQKTNDYLIKFSEGDLKHARRVIDRVWSENLDRIKNLDRNPKLDEEYKEVVFDMIKKGKVEDHIFVIIDFFDSLSLSVENKICDRETAYKFFRVYAKNFLSMYYPYIAHKRILLNDSNFAKGLDLMAQNSATVSSKKN